MFVLVLMRKFEKKQDRKGDPTHYLTVHSDLRLVVWNGAMEGGEYVFSYQVHSMLCAICLWTVFFGFCFS